MNDRTRILVGIDGSLQSKKALIEAITLAKCFSGYVKAVTVYEKNEQQKAEALINEAQKQLIAEGVAHEASSIAGSNAAKELVNLAKQENFDLIVVGSRGIGGRVSILLGSVSKQVVANAYCNVLVVKSKR